MSKVLVVNADSQLTIKRDGDKIALSLELNGLPDQVLDRICQVGAELTVPLVKAVMLNIGGGGRIMDPASAEAWIHGKPPTQVH